jgi:Protein of unknown function (DUF4231)
MTVSQRPSAPGGSFRNECPPRAFRNRPGTATDPTHSRRGRSGCVHGALAWRGSRLALVRRIVSLSIETPYLADVLAAALMEASAACANVPSLVGLNLSGTGGTAVRWLTFTLSLIAALSTAILTLFRFGDRWLMYRRLGNELIAAGWRMINGSGTDLDKAWSSFTDTTNKAISSYYTEYATEIVATVQLKFNGQSEGQDERLGQTNARFLKGCI